MKKPTTRAAIERSRERTRDKVRAKAIAGREGTRIHISFLQAFKDQKYSQ
jgi:hypothetical protein